MGQLEEMEEKTSDLEEQVSKLENILEGLCVAVKDFAKEQCGSCESEALDALREECQVLLYKV